jgi:UDP-N-acetylmuramyl pentapeptide phosphotransferase/UDP-N-acetylglucosamine-1-phosphate transferase
MNALIILPVFLLSMGLTWYLCHPAAALRILDAPNERSLHDVPVPRTGGLAINTALLVGCSPIVFARLLDPGSALLMVAAALIAVVSFIDDRSGVHPKYRLLIHAMAAALVMAGGLIADVFQLPGWQWAWPSAFSLVFTGLFLIWMTNLYNFMDGMDGFAGGMAVFGFSAYAALGWQAGETLFTVASLTIAASAAGFLVFNFPPAKIFMGDVGASVLGFLSGCLSLWAAAEQIFPIWVGILVFSPFIVDATVTLLSRLVAGHRVWSAHRSHYYQRLVQIGWGHRKTVIVEYGLMIAAGLSANMAVVLSPQWQWILIIVWCFLYLGLGLAVRNMESATMRNG